MTSIYETQEKVKLELEEKYFIKIVIFSEKQTSKVSIKAIHEHFNVNYQFLSEIVERFKSYLSLSFDENDSQNPSKMIVCINDEGKRFFFQNIDRYLA